MNYKRDLERIERFTREAKAAAWGPKLVPSEGQRKVKNIELLPLHDMYSRGI
jgi:DnaJ family protein C protein 1